MSSSTGSKLFFGVSVVVSVGVIAFVHYSQNRDRQRMRAGILRDLERRQQNAEELEYQKKLESALRQQLRKGFLLFRKSLQYISLSLTIICIAAAVAKRFFTISISLTK
jgi:hypothetical protein